MKRTLLTLVALLWAVPASAQFVASGASVPSVTVGCVWQVQSLDPVVTICGGAGSGDVTKTGTRTAGTLTKWSSDGVITNSIITESGSVASVATMNVTTAFTINGVSLNTTGTLGNVVYVSTAPALTGTNFTGIPAAGVTGTAAVLNAANVFTNGQTATKFLSGASGWNMQMAGDGTVGAQIMSLTDFSGNSTSNSPAFRLLGDSGNPLYIQTSPATTVASARTFTTRVTVTTAGSVGVGNSATNAKLEVSASSGEVFRADASGGAFRIVADQTGVNFAGTVTSSGNLTTSGTSTEIINGLVGAQGGGITGWTNPNARNTLTLGHVSNLATGGFIIFRNASETAQGSVTATNSTTTAFNTTSDKRMKVDLGAAHTLEVLRNTAVRDFVWKENGIEDRGVFAQDAIFVKPSAVTVGVDSLGLPWSVDYSKYVPDLLVGWQNHESRIAAIEGRLAIVNTADAAEATRLAKAKGKADQQIAVAESRPTRLKAAQDAEVAERATREQRERLRSAITECRTENDLIVTQGGKAQECAKSADEKREAAAMDEEREAAEAEAKKAKQRELALCESRNQKIIKQGGRPLTCGGVQ